MIMRKVLLTLSLLFTFAASINAQPPWRAKFIVYFLDSANKLISDTVWFGCDSQCSIGYQNGFDVYKDSPLVYNSVYSIDPHLGKDKPLKINIVGFKINEPTILSFECFGNPIAVKWDTTEFTYNDHQPFYLKYAFVESPGSIYYDEILHKEFFEIIFHRYKNEGVYKRDSAVMWPQTFLPDMHLFVLFRDTLQVGLTRVVKDCNRVNHNKDVLSIEIDLDTDNTLMTIMNALGQIVSKSSLHKGVNKLNTTELKHGIYYVYIQNREEIFYYKFIK